MIADNQDKFNSPYDPKKTEPEIYKRWEESGFFNPDNLEVAENAKSYAIVLPHPNVTSTLHMGARAQRNYSGYFQYLKS